MRVSAVPFYADTLGGIDPNAKTRRGSRNFHTFRSADASTLGHRSTITEVKIQLQHFVAETHRFTVITADNFNRFLTTSIIVGGIQDTVFATIIILRRSGSTILVDTVLKVPHQCR